MGLKAMAWSWRCILDLGHSSFAGLIQFTQKVHHSQGMSAEKKISQTVLETQVWNHQKGNLN